MGKLAQQLSCQSDVKCFAKGGKVHSDEKEDKAMVKAMVKPEALKGCCGPAKKTPMKSKKSK
jgi:hypothetical protein